MPRVKPYTGFRSVQKAVEKSGEKPPMKMKGEKKDMRPMKAMKGCK